MTCNTEGISKVLLEVVGEDYLSVAERLSEGDNSKCKDAAGLIHMIKFLYRDREQLGLRKTSERYLADLFKILWSTGVSFTWESIRHITHLYLLQTGNCVHILPTKSPVKPKYLKIVQAANVWRECLDIVTFFVQTARQHNLPLEHVNLRNGMFETLAILKDILPVEGVNITTNVVSPVKFDDLITHGKCAFVRGKTGRFFPSHFIQKGSKEWMDL